MSGSTGASGNKTSAIIDPTLIGRITSYEVIPIWSNCLEPIKVDEKLLAFTLFSQQKQGDPFIFWKLRTEIVEQERKRRKRGTTTSSTRRPNFKNLNRRETFSKNKMLTPLEILSAILMLALQYQTEDHLPTSHHLRHSGSTAHTARSIQ
ncbi:hypothetical protein Tco_1531408 [Tanacetum coccineum]